MNDELSDGKRSLDERFGQRPHVRERLHRIADMMDQALAEGCSADEAEARAIEQVRQLGRELMQDWAQQKEEMSRKQAQAQQPCAIKHIKKK